MELKQGFIYRYYKDIKKLNKKTSHSNKPVIFYIVIFSF